MDQQAGLEAMRKQIGVGGSRGSEQISWIGAQFPAVELSLQILARLARGVGDQPDWQTRVAQPVECFDRSRQEILTNGDHPADVEQNASDHMTNLTGRSKYGYQL